MGRATPMTMTRPTDFRATITGPTKWPRRVSTARSIAASKPRSRNALPIGTVCAPNVRSWSHYAAIDWSGAAGERHRGIAIALCGTDGPPVLVRPGHRWSRAEVLAWLTGEMPDDTLVGLDLSGSMPFADAGAYFPDWDESPADAR